MKRERKRVVALKKRVITTKKGFVTLTAIIAFISIFILLSISLISASIKSNKNNYNTGEVVYAVSTVGVNDNLCRSQSPPATVTLYIVENKETWTDGDSFTEVISVEVPNSRFSNKKIWEAPKPGSYDLIIDCNNDKKYSEASEPLYNTGFTVKVKPGIGIVLEGERKILDFSYSYDPEEVDTNSEILQLKLLVKNEDIKLTNLEIEQSSPENSTINLEVYIDKNNNGYLNDVDALIGSFEAQNKTNSVSLDYSLSSGINESLLLVYKMNENYLKGSYSIKINSLAGTGVLSEKLITFTELPKISNIMTVLDKKSCLGSLELTLTPNPASKKSVITAKISNLTGCDGKIASLRTTACPTALKNEIGSCVLQNNECQISFNFLEGKYYACIDKTGDNDFADFGETDIEELTVEVLPIEELLNITNQTITSEQNQTLSPITGNVITDFFKKLNLTGFTLLLEITLILILFVLFLIFLRLRGPVEVS